MDTGPNRLISELFFGPIMLELICANCKTNIGRVIGGYIQEMGKVTCTKCLEEIKSKQ
jgi:DNA-directed RNA polymerase subunit RPC12/RpoP